jgi:hypothetical protein
MGTRSIIKVHDKNGKSIICMYRQFDGSLRYAGKQYLHFVKSLRLVDGYSAGDKKQANGMGCLAAQLVKKFKKLTGGFYLELPETKMFEVDAEFEYLIQPAAFSKNGLALFYRVDSKDKFIELWPKIDKISKLNMYPKKEG